MGVDFRPLNKSVPFSFPFSFSFIDDNLFLLELDTVAKQVRRRVPDVGFAAG
jgi:hypothetical protein